MATNFFHSSLLLLFLDPGSGMGKNQDPDKHPGSATLIFGQCRSGPGSRVLTIKTCKILQLKIPFFYERITIFPMHPRKPSKLQKPSALKYAFSSLFSAYVSHFCPPGSGVS
jgi:hypothetical protein